MLAYIGFSSIMEFWSSSRLSFHSLSLKPKREIPSSLGMPLLLTTIVLLIMMVFVIIWEIFHERIYLNEVLLLLHLTFASGSWFRTIAPTFLEQVSKIVPKIIFFWSFASTLLQIKTFANSPLQEMKFFCCYGPGKWYIRSSLIHLHGFQRLFAAAIAHRNHFVCLY